MRKRKKWIIQDYKALDLETDFDKIQYHGVYGETVLLTVYDHEFFDPFGEVRSHFIDRILIDDGIPLMCVWVPIEKILKRS